MQNHAMLYNAMLYNAMLYNAMLYASYESHFHHIIAAIHFHHIIFHHIIAATHKFWASLIEWR